MFNTSIIYLNRKAVIKNFEFIKSFYGEGIKISSVVKGNAYGHGIEQYVPLALEAGIDHFSVFSADEALRVYSVVKDTANIMIMSSIDDDALIWAIQNGVEFYIISYESFKQTVLLAQKIGRKANIHLEIETGMHRIGIDQKDLNKIVNEIPRYQDNLCIKGVSTHYAGAESIANHVRVSKQISKYNRKYKYLVKKGIVPEKRHTACSAASIVYPKTRMDMVRLGIFQYGFWPTKETFIYYMSKYQNRKDPLERVISWKSKIMSIQNVDEGDFIGYGTSYLAPKEMRVAIIPVGYSDGYSRSLSNQGRVLIHGQLAYVISSVNMNMMIVDVTDIQLAKVGDEVTLIGCVDNNCISVASFSDFNNRLNYELLSRLPLDIPRIVIE